MFDGKSERNRSINTNSYSGSDYLLTRITVRTCCSKEGNDEYGVTVSDRPLDWRRSVEFFVMYSLPSTRVISLMEGYFSMAALPIKP